MHGISRLRVVQALRSTTLNSMFGLVAVLVPLFAAVMAQPVVVNIRWRTGIVDADREAAETRFRLAEGAVTEGTTWQYVLRDPSRGNIRAIVEDPLVEDTHNLDRARFRAYTPPWTQTWLARRALPFGLAIGLLVTVCGAWISPRRFWLALLIAWGAAAVRPPAPLDMLPLTLGGLAATAIIVSLRWRRLDWSALLQAVKGLAARAVAWATSRRAVLSAVGAAATAVLLVTAESQIADAQYFALTFATAILAGDHPYRDFFESGQPLISYMTAGLQRLFGHRLIGEFIRQWTFIVAGVVLSVHLGWRLSRSLTATLVTLPIILLVLAQTPTYHEAKLFFFPLTAWAGWRYIERPGQGRSAVLAAVTAAGFLARHDYGIYLGIGSVVAFVVGRAVATPRDWRAALGECGAYGAAIAIVLAPWAIAVQSNEGLFAYTQSRAALFQSPPSNRILSPLLINPIRQLSPPSPQPRAAEVVIAWTEGTTDGMREQLEQTYGLRRLAGTDVENRQRYEVPNVYDLKLWELRSHLKNDQGFDWAQVAEIRERRPTRDNLNLWLLEMAFCVAFGLLLSGCAHLARAGYRDATDARFMIFAGLFLLTLELALMREYSYVAVVTPLAAGLSARFLVSRSWLVRATATIGVLMTTYAAVMLAWHTPLVSPSADILESTIGTLKTLSLREAHVNERHSYLRDCSAPEDHILITGLTPFEVSYGAERPLAGGHLMWHYGWRSDPARESQSLALLERQSVPFAISTDDPVLDDLAAYRRIQERFRQRYRALDGTNGTILVDVGRAPVRLYGRMNWPCFR